MRFAAVLLGELGAVARRTAAQAQNQRGLALPMAMLSLLIVGSVVGGFVALSASEPAIAHNQLRTSQARALAEGGIERAMWALNNPGEANGLPLTFTTAPPPYDGSQLIPVSTDGRSLGGFRITVANGARPYERDIVAIAWVPSGQPTGVPRAVQKITVTALNPRLIVRDVPGAFAVRGQLDISGQASVDARTDQSCGAKAATISAKATSLAGGSIDLRGAAGDGDARNRIADAGGGSVPLLAADAITNVSPAALDASALSDADLDALRVLAKSRGTYFRGAVSFTAGRRLPNGLVFVDTVRGGNIVVADGIHTPTAPADFGAVDIGAGAVDDPSGTWSGWLIVNGSVSVNDEVRMRGFIHAQSGLAYRATGGFAGAMTSRNIGDLAASRIDADLPGGAAITYDCAAVRSGGGAVPDRWVLKGGSYKELAGS